jgi:hypothetical protein
MGGISCSIQPANNDSAIIVSLTHVRVPHQLPFAAAVLEYQKHRVKKFEEARWRLTQVVSSPRTLENYVAVATPQAPGPRSGLVQYLFCKSSLEEGL